MRTMHRPLRALIAALAILAVTACAPQPAPLQTVRPVRLMSVADGNELSSQVFSGEVRARHESTLGFRVPGKVIRRLVDIGDRVQTGTVLAQIDATDYEHARDSLAAQLGAARAEHSFARDELERHRELAEQKLISPAELDRRDTALQMAAGRLRSLESQLAQATDQLGYARLVADREGVVTAVNVEAGQVVAAGTPVINTNGWTLVNPSYQLTVPLPSGHTYLWTVTGNDSNHTSATAEFTVSVPGAGAGLGCFRHDGERRDAGERRLPDGTAARGGLRAAKRSENRSAGLGLRRCQLDGEIDPREPGTPARGRAHRGAGTRGGDKDRGRRSAQSARGAEGSRARR